MKGCTDYTNEAKSWPQRTGKGLGKTSERRSTRFKVLVASALGVLLLLLVFIVWPSLEGDRLTVATAQETAGDQVLTHVSPEPVAEPQPESATQVVEDPLIVYLTGAVNQPGVYELAQGARLNDAIKLAGGLTGECAANYINLAATLTDGMHIHLPSLAEVESGELARIETGTATVIAGGNVTGQETSGSGAEQSKEKVNINTADSTQLETLPGIGPATAKRIIDYRGKNGSFKRIEDLKNVSGIGDKKYADLVDWVCV